jgi:hypothetical protein
MFDDWWHRVFSKSPAEPDPAALLEHLQRQGLQVTGNFRGDDQGWFSAEITFEDGVAPMQIERYLSLEEGIRGDLNAWAAWMESLDDNPHAEPLMQHMVSTAQVFTLRQPVQLIKALRSTPLCFEACLFLAQATDGVFQIDDRGFFDAQGKLLVDAEEGE